MAAPLRLVLDTNAWLDWLVFGDTQIAPLRAAHAAGEIEIYIDATCTEELRRVLNYKLGKRVLDTATQEAALAECRRIALPCEPDAGVTHAALPLCRDKDDQKFLELARAARADYLVTKDRDLLELARRKYAQTGFRILTPLACVAALAQQAAA